MSDCMSKESYSQRIKECQTTLRKISDSKILGDGTNETWSCGITSSHLLADLLDRVNRPQPENPPLTLEELREMDGEPVWIYNPDTGVCLGCRVIAQYIGNQFNDKCNRFILTDRDSKFDCEYGKTWLAYRHKLEVDK